METDRVTSIVVMGFNGAPIGGASNFVQAKQMQLASIPEPLREYYGGIGTGGQALFYDMPDEVLAAYQDQLQPRET